MNNHPHDTGELTKPFPKRWTVLWVMCGSLVLVVVSVSSLNVAIPAVQQSLGASNTELQWIIDSYALVFAGLLLPAGAIGDRYGRRGALLGGLGIFLVGTLAASVASTPTELIVWRGVMGAGAAFIMPATLSIVATVFPADERAKAIAIWAGFAGAGGALGLLSSGLLLEYFWWGSVMLINVPIVITLIVAVVAVVPTSRDEAETPLDPIGSVLALIGLSALVFGIIEGPEAGWFSARSLGPLMFALGVLVAFLLWELRSQHPMLDPRFLKHRAFSLGSLAITVAFFGIFGMFFVVTQYLQFAQGFSPLEAAVRILPYGLIMLVVAPRSADLAARFGDKVVIVSGMLLGGTGFAVIGLARPESSYGILLIGLALVAIGVGLLMPPATSALIASLPASKAGIASAMNDTTREVGGAVGIAGAGALTAIGYRGGLGSATAALPDDAKELAEDSIGGLIHVVTGLPADGATQLVNEGANAFSDGMRLAMFTAAGLLFLTAVAVGRLFPDHVSQAETQTKDAVSS